MRCVLFVLLAVLLVAAPIAHATRPSRSSDPAPSQGLLHGLLDSLLGPNGILGTLLGSTLSDLLDELGADVSTLVAQVENTVDTTVLQIEVAVAGNDPFLDQLVNAVNNLVQQVEDPTVNQVVSDVTGFHVPFTPVPDFTNVGAAAGSNPGLVGGLLGGATGGLLGGLLGRNARQGLLNGLLSNLLGPNGVLGDLLGSTLGDLLSSVGADLSTLVANVERTVDQVVLQLEVAVAGNNPTLDQLVSAINQVVQQLEDPTVNTIVSDVTGFHVPFTPVPDFTNVEAAAGSNEGLLGGLLGGVTGGLLGRDARKPLASSN